MDLNPDFNDLFVALNAAQARYLVVGGYAVIIYAEPRYTKDLDLLVEASPENAERVWRALAAFGAPMNLFNREDFQDPEMVVHLGVPPNRIDLLMSIEGVEFDAAWGSRTEGHYGTEPIHVIGLDSLILAKRAAGRPQDLVDVAALVEARERSKG